MRLPLLFAAAALAATPAGAAPVTHHAAKPEAKHPPRAEGADKADSANPVHGFFHPSETRSTFPTTPSSVSMVKVTLTRPPSAAWTLSHSW